MEAFRKLWSAHPLTRLVTREAATHLLLAAMLTRYPGQDLIAPQPQPRESLAERLLDGIHTPVLIVNGALDVDSRRRAGLRLLESLPAASHVLIQNAAHLPNLDAPRRIQPTHFRIRQPADAGRRLNNRTRGTQ